MNGDTRTGRYGEVTSSDGTTIGYEVVGTGPRMVAIHGGTADRSRWAAVAPLLARDHEVWLVDRRGRGLSGDAPDGGHSLEREADDVAALCAAAGPGSVVLAHSAGATCALAAAPRLTTVAGMMLYEPAFATPGNLVVDEATFTEVERLLATDDREGALTLFFSRVIGLPEPAIEAMRGTPIWRARLAAVHTLTREGRAVEGYQPDPALLGDLPYPVLVLVGTESPAFLRTASFAAHTAIPGSRLVQLEGQAHMAMDTAPERFAHEVLAFARSVPV